jgi:hypothetical protein
VWFAGAKLGEYANDLEALKAASLHADSLPLIAESVEYELRRDTMKYIVHRRITGPDAPALGPVLTISSTALTVTLDRPASGPTQIDRYELERYNGAAWVQIASGLSIFGASNQYADSSLTASTAYQYRCRAVDTTQRASEYSYSSGTTSAGASNTAPAWQSGTLALTVQAGSSVSLSPYCSDPEGDQITYTLVDTTPTDTTISVSQSGVLQTTAATAVGANTVVVRADDGALTASKAIALTVTAASTGQTFTILAGTATYNASAVQPGDTIIIEGDVNGNRGPLMITNANGSASSRITIRNPTTKRINLGATAASTFVFVVNGCSYVTIDGGFVGSQYGLLFTAPNSSSGVGHFVKLVGFNHHVTIRNFEVDGKITSFSTASGVPIGVGLHDNLLLRTSYPGVFQQHDLLVENFYIHNVRGEGIYAGPNWTTGACPLKDIEICNGLIEDTGRDGCQVKAWYEGENSIHDLVCNRVGRNSNDEAGQRFGISVASGKADVYNNVINGSGESGIQFYTQNGPDSDVTFNSYGPYSEFISQCYNNLVHDTGLIDTGTVNAGNGIIVSADSSLRVKTTPKIYNNTCVAIENYGVNISTAGAGFLRNNILLDCGTAAYSLGSGGTTQTNNLTVGTVSNTFVAPELENYHLKAEQTAAGTIGIDISSADIEGTSRAGTASKGAYEFS